MGYEVRVFDLINPDTSFCYNPFCYVHDDKDVLKLINNLIRNTTPKGSQASDPFLGECDLFVGGKKAYAQS